MSVNVTSVKCKFVQRTYITKRTRCVCKTLMPLPHNCNWADLKGDNWSK